MSWCAGRQWVVRGGLVVSAAWLVGCGVGSSASPEAPDWERPGEPGLPVSVAPFTVAVAPGTVVDCLGTLVHPHWVLSTAHCFSQTSPSTWIFLRDFGASARVEDAVLHPEAVALDDFEPGGYFNHDIVAAHDLALIPLKYPVESARLAKLWRPESADLEALTGMHLGYGRGAVGHSSTEFGISEGVLRASDLLSDQSQQGQLLGVRGRVPTGGDSGGGAFTVVEDPTSDETLLVAVVQNAPLDEERGRFGLVPLWLKEHQAFIDDVAVDPEVE